MLYPVEDKEEQKLIFNCRICNKSEDATAFCVYRNELSNTIGETAGITQDVGQDPTVGSLPVCTMCGQEILCEQCGNPQPDSYLHFEVEDYDADSGEQEPSLRQSEESQRSSESERSHEGKKSAKS